MKHFNKNKKHILHLPKWYPHPADVQNGVFIKKHIGVAAEKYNCSVVFATSAKQKIPYFIDSQFDEGVFTVKVFFKEFNHQNPLKSFIHAFRYFVALTKGLKVAKQKFGKPDLIHAHVLLRTGLIAWFYGIYFNIPFIVSEHWSGFINGNFDKKSPVYRKLAEFVLGRAERIIVVSGILKAALVKLSVKNSKITVVPNVVDALPQAGSKPPKTESDTVIIVTVADLVDEIKNISDVIKVVAGLSQNFKIEYWIVGDGADKEKLVGLATSLGVMDKQVFFVGRKTNEEVLKILNEVDFMVLNSISETFSVVTAEALLAGKPVIATRCGGPEIFVNETNGILIEPGNPEALKAAIIGMIGKYKSYNPEILKSTIREKFGREAVGSKIQTIYDEIIG
jgi:glycosyltransferase involved in cell wall biosynthesis